jgi:hypothetical protein
VEGSAHKLNMYYQPIGTPGWHPEEVDLDNTTFSAPSVAQVASSTVIAVHGPVGCLHFYYQPIGKPGWSSREQVNCASL